jgi:hypothetical protein
MYYTEKLIYDREKNSFPGKLFLTMIVMMFVGGGGGASVLDGILVLFLPYKTYGAGGFCSRPNPYRGYPV